jgi:DNA (cytosine-5)-methyltransferase 1
LFGRRKKLRGGFDCYLELERNNILVRKQADSKDSQIAVIDLFSGPGGLSLGMETAGLGFNVVVAVECDPYASETYKENFRDTELVSQRVEDVHGDKLLDIASRNNYRKLFLIGGPPCQPFSKANLKNNGSKHPSVSAVDHFVRLIEEMRPDAFLFENVTNFQRIDKGESVNRMIRKLSKELHYKVSAAELNSEDFGVPQHRVRLHIGGIQDDIRENFDLNALSTKKRKKNATVRDAISDLPLLEDGGGGSNEMDYPRNQEIRPFQKRARRGSKILHNHWSSKNSAEVIDTIRHIAPGSSLRKSWDSLPERSKIRYKSPENIHSNIYKRLSWEGSSPTIVHPRRAMLLHPLRNRILTVREAARLQSFPDKFKFTGYVHNQYQQVANAVPPFVAEALANFYANYLGDEK